jgi:NAD-dependent SIR2 family protein deacetylase
MNFNEIKNTIEHLKKTCKCQQCNNRYDDKDISVIATTNIEGMMEMRCDKCKTSTLVTVIIAPEIEIKENNSRTHKGISDNDILDVKNFLNNFDGDFKKAFKQSYNKNI